MARRVVPSLPCVELMVRSEGGMVAVSKILRSRLYGGERRELAGIGMRCVCPGSARRFFAL
jgi:hypothetical protein